ncbi:phage tail protein [Vibrio rumoiensis]|uniref:phage tail-collar fiber domain-containing protein n=1 Tax=Vibrio rumoiensis TaxID=76258 RepID=UPI003AA88960
MADLRCYLTKSGIAAENNAKQFGTTLKITEMVFDGSYLADEENPENLTEVINPVLTVPCSTTISDDEQTLTFKGSILVEQGGFNVWGIGLKTDSGVLYGYARSKGDKILTEDEGATESVRYAVDIITKNSEVVEINVNPSTVYADLEDVDNAVKAGIDEHEAKEDPHPQYLLTAQFLRAMLGKPVHESIVGRTQDDDLIAPAVGQKLYVADYQTAYEIISQADNFIEEATKAADPFQYAGYWGFGNDGADFFTTPNLPLTMHIKSAGSYGNAGESKEDHLQNVTAEVQFYDESAPARIFQKNSVKGAFSSEGTTNSTLLATATAAKSALVDRGDKLLFDMSTVARTDSTFTDSMGTFFDPYIWLPKGVI